MEKLDDLALIRRLDKQLLLDCLIRVPEDIRKAVGMAEAIEIPDRYASAEKVIVSGLGGSAIPGDMVKDLHDPFSSLPIEVCRGSSIPAYADSRTLFLGVSYSGNTEETLSAFVKAVERDCMTIGVTSDGVLEDFCTQLGSPCMKIPSGLAPRAALPYLLFSILVILRRLGIVSLEDSDIDGTVKTIEKLREEISPEIKTENNVAKRMALGIHGTIPVVYGDSIFKAAATRIKTQFNENAKMMAKWEYFPELLHNEIVGWEGVDELAHSLSVLLIRDGEEDERRRMEITATKELIARRGTKIFEIWAQGDSSIARLLSVVYIGDFTSFYLTILRGLDPTPVGSIDEVKERLSKLGTIEELRRRVRELKVRKTTSP
ncbi:MAG: bifunctional phosphoglucose/phosphomannose isomerase [Candidatus Bathyarchaeia archaeon]